VLDDPAEVALHDTWYDPPDGPLGPALDGWRRDHALEEAVKLVVGLAHVAIAAAVWGWHQQAEPDMRAADAARGLDVFGNVGGKPSKEHRVELVDVEAMTDGGGGDDVAQTLWN